MRTLTYDRIAASDVDELLTTGEAASMLNSSRQHVVDLCDRGDLSFTTVGTHRRVRKADVEMLRERTQRLTRDQRRSLWLAYAVAGRIVADPNEAGRLAFENLERMRTTSRGQARRWLEWERLLRGPLDKLLAGASVRRLVGALDGLAEHDGLNMCPTLEPGDGGRAHRSVGGCRLRGAPPGDSIIPKSVPIRYDFE